MSKEYRDAAWGVSLKPERKIVLLFLAERANDNGICWPSMASIASACEMTQRGAEKIVAAFIAGGLMERVSMGGGRGNPSSYRLLVTKQTPNGATRNPEPETPNEETPNRKTPNLGSGFSNQNPEPGNGECETETPNENAETPNGATRNPEREVAHIRNNRHGTVMEPSESVSAREPETVSTLYEANYGHAPPIFGLERLGAITDLDVWREVMIAWKANGWRPNNFDAMAREYKARVERKARDAANNTGQTTKLNAVDRNAQRLRERDYDEFDRVQALRKQGGA